MATIYEKLIDTFKFTYSYSSVEKGLMIYCSHCKTFHPADYIAHVAYTHLSYYTSDFEIFYEHEGFNQLAISYKDKAPKQGRPHTGRHYDILKKYIIDETVRPAYLSHAKAKRIQDKDYSSRYAKEIEGKKYYKRYVVKDYVCSNCHARYPRQNMLNFDIKSKDSKFASICYGAYVYDEVNSKNQKLLKANYCFLDYSCFNDRIQTSKSRVKLVVNIETGQSYIIGRKLISGTRRKYHTHPICNVSLNQNRGLMMNENYYGSLEAFEATQVLFKRVYEEKALLLGHNPDGFKESIIGTPYVISRLNRHPNVPIELVDKNNASGMFYYNFDEKHIARKLMRTYKHTDNDFVGHILKASNITPTKRLRKYVREGLVDVHTLKAYMSYFKDINNIYKLIEAKNTHILQTSYVEFLEDFIKVLGENVAINKLLSDTHHDFQDTAYQYLQLKRFLERNVNRELEADEEPVIIDLSFDGTLHEIHDRYAKQYHKISNKNVKLKYTAEQHALEVLDHPKYLLRLAKDTHELTDVGRIMSICVGSYGKRAASSHCHIVLVINKDTDKLVGCIELNSEMTELKQAKGFANYRIEDGAYEFVVDWMNQKEILNGNYYDILKEGYEDYLRETHAQAMQRRKEKKEENIDFAVPAPRQIVRAANNEEDEDDDLFGLAF